MNASPMAKSYASGQRATATKMRHCRAIALPRQSGYDLWLLPTMQKRRRKGVIRSCFSASWLTQAAPVRTALPGAIAGCAIALPVGLHVVRGRCRSRDLCRADRSGRRALQSGPRQSECRPPQGGQPQVRRGRPPASLFGIRPQIDGDGRLRQLPAGQLRRGDQRRPSAIVDALSVDPRMRPTRSTSSA